MTKVVKHKYRIMNIKEGKLRRSKIKRLLNKAQKVSINS